MSGYKNVLDILGLGGGKLERMCKRSLGLGDS